MMRKVVVGIIGAVMAITLAGCGAVSAVTQSFVVPCEANKYEQVVWSPDGKHIAFLARHNGARVYVMEPNGAGIRLLADGITFGSNLQWLPDSQTLAFSDYSALKTVSLDGTRSEIISGTLLLAGARFSPDGKALAYDRSHFQEAFGYDVAGIDRVSIDGLENTPLTSGRDRIQAWSPDGTRIAYAHIEGPGQNLVMTIRADGSDERQLAEGFLPIRWSPDGQWIGFASYDGGVTLNIIRPDGTGEKMVVADVFSSPILISWLPDSRHIAFSSRQSRYLNVIDVNTLVVETLATVGAVEIPPSWSPDGTQVVFVGFGHTSFNPYIEDIYVVNRDGTGLTRLTDNPGKYQCLRWPL